MPAHKQSAKHLHVFSCACACAFMCVRVRDRFMRLHGWRARERVHARAYARARTHTHTHTGLLECFPGAGRTSSTLRLRVLSGSFSGLMVARWRWRSFVMLLRPFTSCALAALPDTDSQKSVPSKLTIYSHYVDSF